MSNPLTRSLLRLSKRSKSGSNISDRDSIRSEISDLSEIENVDWTKYDERLIECINKSDIHKLKEVLKKKHVSPVKISRVGKTAIHVAVKKRYMEGVDLMLLEHPDLSCVDTQGRTVYHIAAINGDTIMLKKLVDYSKWNLDIKDLKGMTALHYAVQSGELECIRILLRNDCPADAQDSEGRTALLIAVTEDREKIATLLIEHGVNLNAEDKQRRTAMVIACSMGMTQVVSLLLSKGADKSLMHRASINLGKLAADAGHSDIVQLLKKEIRLASDENGNTREDVISEVDEVHLDDDQPHVNGEINGGEVNGEVNGMLDDNHVNGEVNGISDDNHVNGEVNGIADNNHNGEVNGISNGNHVNGEAVNGDKHSVNGHCEVFVDIPVNASIEKKSSSESILTGNQKNSTPIPRIQITSTSSAPVRRSMYADDNSLTSSIIESLMSLDGGMSDTMSETSVTEDQLHLNEREEEEKKELKNALVQKELHIEELQAEIDSLKNKVSREMEFRFSAEKEVRQLKLDLEVKSQHSECESEQVSISHSLVSSEEALDLSPVDESKMKNDGGQSNENQHDIIEGEEEKEKEEEEEDKEEENQEVEEKEEQVESMRSIKSVHIDSEVTEVYSGHDSESDIEKMHDGHIPGSDTDDSVSVITGYRKKSLGTAKQHINVLEERILCLEDELSYKNEQIMELEEECRNAKEFLELNNKTVVPLEIHNELKSDSRKDRNAYKEKISSLEEKVRALEGEATSKSLSVEGEIHLDRTEAKNGINKISYETDIDADETELYCNINGHVHLEGQVSSLKEKVSELQEKLSINDCTLKDAICCYRDNIIAMYQNNLDTTLEEILASIVKLRTS